MPTLFRLPKFLTSEDGRHSEQYECLSCHETFERRHQVCTACGGYDIRSTEWLDEQITADSSKRE